MSLKEETKSVDRFTGKKNDSKKEFDFDKKIFDARYVDYVIRLNWLFTIYIYMICNFFNYVQNCKKREGKEERDFSNAK